MWVIMIQHKTSDQYLTSGKVSARSIHGLKRYRLLKTLTKNFYILCNVDADANANAYAMVTTIALPVLSYRRDKKDRVKSTEKKYRVKKQPRKGGEIIFPIISQWGLSVAMETRVFIQSAPKPYAAFPPPQ